MAKSDLFRPLRYCGRNSIVIYLAFFLPMAATAHAAAQDRPHPRHRHHGARRHRGRRHRPLALFWAVRGTRLALPVRAPGHVLAHAEAAARAAAGGISSVIRQPGLTRQSMGAVACDTRVKPGVTNVGQPSSAGTVNSARNAYIRRHASTEIQARAAASAPAAVRQERRPRLSGRRLGLHFPRLSRAAAAQPQVGRPAAQRRARLLQHAVEAVARHEAGGQADPSRGRVRQVGADVPQRDLSRLQGAPARPAGRSASRSSR